MAKFVAIVVASPAKSCGRLERIPERSRAQRLRRDRGMSWSREEKDPIIRHSAVTRHRTASASYCSAPISGKLMTKFTRYLSHDALGMRGVTHFWAISKVTWANFTVLNCA
ncbi:hypothetical protein FB451DRAFT_1185087 [Mycena latifolia]|nr:hypothetical protein FB451DRAFT_1185087 [Mycena latifolia]